MKPASGENAGKPKISKPFYSFANAAAHSGSSLRGLLTRVETLTAASASPRHGVSKVDSRSASEGGAFSQSS
jgi:hypothetical protein